jgi:hypothetical protein
MERDWGMIVGPSLGRRSYPASYENGVLVVVVDGRSATHDMNFKKNAIIREILVKTGIRINDIRTRMAGSGVDAADRPGASQVRGVARRPFAADEKVVDALKREIISKHAGMDPRLAGAIARCMALRGGFRPGTRS